MSPGCSSLIKEDDKELRDSISFSIPQEADLWPRRGPVLKADGKCLVVCLGNAVIFTMFFLYTVLMSWGPWGVHCMVWFGWAQNPRHAPEASGTCLPETLASSILQSLCCCTHGLTRDCHVPRVAYSSCASQDHTVLHSHWCISWCHRRMQTF